MKSAYIPSFDLLSTIKKHTFYRDTPLMSVCACVCASTHANTPNRHKHTQSGIKDNDSDNGCNSSGSSTDIACYPVNARTFDFSVTKTISLTNAVLVSGLGFV